MSTKAIREALKDYSRITGKADEALRELDALEQAATWFASEDQDLEAAVEYMETMRRIAEDAP